MQKTFLSEFKKTAADFLASDLYIIFLSALSFLGFSSGAFTPVICGMLILSAVGALISKNLNHVLAVLIICPISMGVNEVKQADIILIVIFSLILAASVIINLVIYKRDKSIFSPTKIKGYGVSLVLFAFGFLLSGIFSPYPYTPNLIAFLLVLVIAIFYFVLYIGLKGYTNLIEYVIKTIFCLAIAVVCEFAFTLLSLDSVEQITDYLIGKHFWVGWTGPNTAASVISLGVPCALFLCTKKSNLAFIKIPLLIVSAFVFLLAEVASGSRGAMLFTAVILLPLILFSMWKTHHKLTFLVSVSAVFLVAIGLIALFIEPLKEILISIINKGFSSSGRVESLYPEAFELFLEYPVFGAGFGYKLSQNLSGFSQPYYFHSTLLQIMANCGVTGTIMLFVLYFRRYYFIVMIKQPAFVFMLANLLLFDLYSLIDTSIFNPMLFILTCIMVLAMEIDSPEDKSLAFFGKNPLNILKKRANKK